MLLDNLYSNQNLLNKNLNIIDQDDFSNVNNKISNDSQKENLNERSNFEKRKNNNLSSLLIENNTTIINNDNKRKTLTSEKFDRKSFHEMNNFNADLIKKITNNNISLHQLNYNEIYLTNDTFLQNNASIHKNHTDYSNLCDKNFLEYNEGENNFEFDNYTSNINLNNNYDNCDSNLSDIYFKCQKQNKNDIGKNFDNAENKFFDFVLNQVQKKNLDKKNKKQKNKNIDKILNNVSSNLIDTKNLYDDDNVNNSLDNSLNLNFDNSKNIGNKIVLSETFNDVDLDTNNQKNKEKDESIQSGVKMIHNKINMNLDRNNQSLFELNKSIFSYLNN